MFYKSMFFKSMFYKSMFFKSMFYKSMFYKSMFYKSMFCKSMFYKSMFYKSMFYKSMFYKSMFYKSMFYKSMFYKPCFTSPCFTSPCFTSPCLVTSPVQSKVQSMFYNMPQESSVRREQYVQSSALNKRWVTLQIQAWLSYKIGFRLKLHLQHHNYNNTLILKEWKFNLSFSWVSILFLNSWRMSSHIVMSSHTLTLQQK
jgi:hypothetical protein